MRFVMVDVVALVMVKPSFVHMDVAAILLSLFLRCFLFQAGKKGKESHMVLSSYFALIFSFSGA